MDKSWIGLLIILSVTVALVYSLYVFRFNKLKQDYNQSFDEAESQLLKISMGCREELTKRLQEISLLIEVINSYHGYTTSKEVSYKLSLEAALEKLPAEIRDLIEIKI